MTLFISYPHIPWSAKVTSSAQIYTEGYSYRNSIYSDRPLVSKCTAGASGLIEIQYDLGPALTTTVDHIVVGKAKKLSDVGTTTLSLAGNNTGIDAAYTALWSQASLSASANNSLGTRSEDYLIYGLSLAAYRVWKFGITGGSATARTFGQVYFGNAFSMGNGLDYSFDLIQDSEVDFDTSSGAKKLTRHDDFRYQFDFTWSGVTDTELQNWHSKIVNNSDRHNFFLYTNSAHEVLNNQKIVQVKLKTASSFNQKVNYNEVTAAFEEVLG